MYKNIYSAKKIRRPKKDMMKIQSLNKNTTVIDILSFNDQAKQILLDSRDFR